MKPLSVVTIHENLQLLIFEEYKPVTQYELQESDLLFEEVNVCFSFKLTVRIRRHDHF